MHTIQVRTTQNVFIHYPVASVGDRILAYLLDGLIKVLFIVAIVALFINIELETYWIWIAAITTPLLLYSVLFEIFMNGQTPGKIALNIKVIRLDGAPPTVGDYLLRWIFGLVDFGILSGAIAVILIAAGGKGQRLGDIVAGTSVIKQIEQKEITASEIFVVPDTAYQPVFQEATQLSGRDIEIIQQALEVNVSQGNSVPVLAITEKVKTQLGIQTDLPPAEFLYTIVRDFNHLNAR